MRAQATCLGHPIHPMLVVFPLGLFPVAVIFDVIYWFTKNPTWAQISYWIIAAGIIGALLAAVFGLADWLKIPDGTRAKTIGLVHGGTNVIAVGLSALVGSCAGRIPLRRTCSTLRLGSSAYCSPSSPVGLVVSLFIA